MLTNEELRKLKEGQPNIFYDADHKFHLAIAEASHNRLFVQFIHSIHGTLHIHQVLSLKETEPIDEVKYYHQKILEAIVEKNADKAARMMLSHIDRIEELIIKGLSKKKNQGKHTSLDPK